MTPHAERMSPVDTAWLRMDGAHNLMTIVGVWLLQPALDRARLLRRLRERLLVYRRFRQKVVEDALGRRWVDDEDFDLRRHVVSEVLPRGRSARAALQRRAAALATEPLDPAHPLWRMHLFGAYQGGGAVILRIHHCIADGIALNAVLLSIVDGGVDLHPAPPDAPAPGEAGIVGGLLQPLTRAAVEAIERSGAGLATALHALAQPPLEGAAALAREGVRVLRDAAALALMDDDSPTLLKGPLDGVKRVAWCEPLPLDEVKAVGHALGCSVNDVLLACVAGAIGGWLREHGDDPAGKAIRAMVPVNLRAPADAWQLGNRFGLAPVLLPVGIDNPVERVYAVCDRMGAMKGSWQPLLAYGILALSGSLARPLQDAISGPFQRKTTAVMTNLPGPARPVRICGSTLRQSIFWVPQAGEIGVGVSIVSYRGGVQFGLITDRARCDEPQRIIDRFAPEFEALLLTTLMLPRAVEAAPPAGTRRPARPARR